VPESISHALFTCIWSCYTLVKDIEKERKRAQKQSSEFLFIWASYCHNTWRDSFSIVVFFYMMWCRYQSMRSNHNTYIYNNRSRHGGFSSFIFYCHSILILYLLFKLINANFLRRFLLVVWRLVVQTSNFNQNDFFFEHVGMWIKKNRERKRKW
jgi:hypothetical protein